MFKSNKKELLKQLNIKKDIALETIGLFVEAEAKTRTPVDTGNLRGSINHSVLKESVVIGTNVEYALYLEKGTSKQRQQAFLEPAVKENIKEITKIMKKVYK